MNTTSPVFVTGMPRSGTTFVQHLLSQHPRIRISGQEPAGMRWGDWLRIVVDGVESANASNDELEYDIPHYAAPRNSHDAATGFLEYIRWYLTGGMTPKRWGAKSLTECRVVPEAVLDVWPDTRWIVCIRDPFRSIESLRNTFDAQQNVELSLAVSWWTEAARFAHSQEAALPVQFDRLTEPAERQQFVERLFDFIDEDITPEVEDFADRWPVVHKVVADADRAYSLSSTDRERLLHEYPEFHSWVERLGYLTTEATAS